MGTGRDYAVEDALDESGIRRFTFSTGIIAFRPCPWCYDSQRRGGCIYRPQKFSGYCKACRVTFHKTELVAQLGLYRDEPGWWQQAMDEIKARATATAAHEWCDDPACPTCPPFEVEP